MKKTTKNNIVTCGIVLVFFIICSILSSAGILGSKLSGLLIPIGIYIILSVSLNLTVGILGELSLGHAGFMCVGAYVGGVFSILVQDTVTSPIVRIILAIIIGGIAAAIFGCRVQNAVCDFAFKAYAAALRDGKAVVVSDNIRGIYCLGEGEHALCEAGVYIA